MQSRADHLVESKLGHITAEERLTLIKQVLDNDAINVKTLGRIACAGVPGGCGVRAQVWQLLLGYLPTDKTAWEATLSSRRAEYPSFCRDFMISPSTANQLRGRSYASGMDMVWAKYLKVHSASDDPLSTAEDSAWGQYFRDVEELEQIQRDVERTHSSNDFFGGDSEEAVRHRKELERLLFVFSKLNPGIRYVQGMNELVAPLYMVFSQDAVDEASAAYAEADTFYCFVRLLTVSDNRDLYCKSLDKSNSGVKAVLHDFMDRLQGADPTIAKHLAAQNVDPHYFAFRWLTVMFVQDVDSLDDVLRLWDFLLGDSGGCKDALMRVCIALILRRRDRLLLTEFPEIIKVLQSCGREEFDAEDAINVAQSLTSKYIL